MESKTICSTKEGSPTKFLADPTDVWRCKWRSPHGRIAQMAAIDLDQPDDQGL